MYTVSSPTNAELRAAPDFLRVQHETLDVSYERAWALTGPFHANEGIWLEQESAKETALSKRDSVVGGARRILRVHGSYQYGKRPTDIRYRHRYTK